MVASQCTRMPATRFYARCPTYTASRYQVHCTLLHAVVYYDVFWPSVDISYRSERLFCVGYLTVDLKTDGFPYYLRRNMELTGMPCFQGV
eukprot:IDg11719t1